MARSASVMVIHDGAAPALVACFMADRIPDVIAWVPPATSGLRSSTGSDDEILRVVERQQEVVCWGRTVVGIDPTGAAGAAPALRRASSLLQAASQALALGCTTVVWPVVCSGDAGAIDEAGELASGVTRLVWLAQPRHGGGGKVLGPDFRIETPFADLTMPQIADLAEDLRVPLELCPDPLTQTGRGIRAAAGAARAVASRGA